MHKVLQDPNRVLLSLSTAELEAITQLVRLASEGAPPSGLVLAPSPLLSAMLSALVADVHESRRTGELVQAWEDGSVMVRVMNTYGDAVEMGEVAAEEFAEQLRRAMEAAS